MFSFLKKSSDSKDVTPAKEEAVDEPVVEEPVGESAPPSTGFSFMSSNSTPADENVDEASPSTGFSFMGGGSDDTDGAEKTSVSLSGFGFMSSSSPGVGEDSAASVTAEPTSSFSFMGSPSPQPVESAPVPSTVSPVSRPVAVPVPKKVIKKRASAARVGMGRTRSTDEAPRTPEPISEEPERETELSGDSATEVAIPAPAATTAGMEEDRSRVDSGKLAAIAGAATGEEEEEEKPETENTVAFSYSAARTSGDETVLNTGYSSSSNLKAVMTTATMTPLELLQHDAGEILRGFIDDVDRACKEHELAASQRRSAQEQREQTQAALEGAAGELALAEEEQLACAEAEEFEKADALCAVIDALTSQVATLEAQLAAMQVAQAASGGPSDSKELSASTLSPAAISTHVSAQRLLDRTAVTSVFSFVAVHFLCV